jgi:hypothetical protein
MMMVMMMMKGEPHLYVVSGPLGSPNVMVGGLLGRLYG